MECCAFIWRLGQLFTLINVISVDYILRSIIYDDIQESTLANNELAKQDDSFVYPFLSSEKFARWHKY